MNAPQPPPNLPPPPKTPEQEAAERHRRQLRMSYGAFFGSEHGKVVLADLKYRYGFAEDGTELPIYIPGLDAATVSNRDGMREPVRHILRQQTQPEKPEQKSTTATS